MYVSLWNQKDCYDYECIYCNEKVKFMKYYCPKCMKKMVYDIDINSSEDTNFLFNQLPHKIQNKIVNEFIIDLSDRIVKILLKNCNKE